MDPNRNLLNEDLQIDSIATTHLKETAMWSKLFAIIGLVVSVLIAIVSFFIGSIFQGLPGGMDMPATFSITMTIMYLFIGAIYFFLSLYMLKFANKMKEALTTINQESFNSALQSQKIVYRIMGIITIIYLLFVVLALLGGLGAAMLGS